MINKIKSLGLVFAVAIALTASVSVSADTISDLQTQIAALTAQLSALSGSSATASYTFNTDLTVGSTGADVTALQNWLIAGGYSIPAGATGYFGAQTQAAVAAYQSANGISPAAGYFGPITRAYVNSHETTTTTTTTTTTSTTSGCVAGAAFSSTTGQACATTTTTGTVGTTGTGITTIGSEGVLTVTGSNVNLVSQAYAGDTKDGVLGFKAQAQNSDISIQRIELYLGTSTTAYNKVFSNLYVTDDSGKIYASVPLNSNTVIEEDNGTSTQYFVTITGFNILVPNNTTKNVYILADLYPSIDSQYENPITLQLADLGVRGIDGAGVDEYAPNTGSSVSRTTPIDDTLSDSAQLTVSTDQNTPLSNEIIAASGAAYNQTVIGSPVTLLNFDLQAQSDNIEVKNLSVNVGQTGGTGGASIQNVYLYGPNGQSLDSASPSNGVVTFTQLNYTIPNNTTQVFTIKADIQNATTASTTFQASTTASLINAQNSQGDTITGGNLNGSAIGNLFSFRNVGPQFALVSSPTVTKSSGGNSNTGTSTSILTATFDIKATAVGGTVNFGATGSTSPAFGSSTAAVVVYKDGVPDLTNASNSQYNMTVSYSQPSTGVTISPNGLTYSVSQNNTAEFLVTYSISLSGLPSTHTYAIQLAGINWQTPGTVGVQTSNFFSTQTAWRTAAISLP